MGKQTGWALGDVNAGPLTRSERAFAAQAGAVRAERDRVNAALRGRLFVFGLPAEVCGDPNGRGEDRPVVQVAYGHPLAGMVGEAVAASVLREWVADGLPHDLYTGWVVTRAGKEVAG